METERQMCRARGDLFSGGETGKGRQQIHRRPGLGAKCQQLSRDVDHSIAGGQMEFKDIILKAAVGAQ